MRAWVSTFITFYELSHHKKIDKIIICEPFVIYLLKSTANSAKMSQIVFAFSRQIANGSNDFDFFNFHRFIKDETH